MRPGARKSVLIVDGDHKVRAVLRAILEDAGYMVHEAAHGGMAEEHVARVHTDVVITDLTALGDVLEGIRKLAGTAPDLKIIAISGAAEASWLTIALVAGAAKALRKPFCGSEILVAVADLVGPS